MPRLAPLAAAAVLAAVVPAAASAQYSVALRAGYGTVAGYAYDDPIDRTGVDMSSIFSWQIPLQAEFLYKLNPRVELGAYASYVFNGLGGTVESVCMTNALSCSGRTIRVGVQAFYHFLERSPKLFPWVGLGVGWEWMRYEQGATGTTLRLSFNGIEALGVQAGFDYKLNERFTLGPYVLGTLGIYTGAQQEVTGRGTETVSIGKTLHEWLSLGIRARYSW